VWNSGGYSGPDGSFQSPALITRLAC